MVETRSQQEQDLIAWASTLTKKDVDALTAFMEQFLVTTPADTLQLPEFSGFDHEDPQNFLELCEKGLATTNPAPTYEDLKRAVVNKYGGPEIVIELHAQYYGTRQAVGESTDSFLSRKTYRKTNFPQHHGGKVHCHVPFPGNRSSRTTATTPPR
jgi:hypothetical protein